MALDDVTWLNANYVQEILRNVREDESIEVSSITVKPATAIGDNYGSDMLRIFVEISRSQESHTNVENLSLIAKVVPQSGKRAEMLAGGGFFETEMSMMSDTLPKMSQILNEVSTPSLAAQCFHVQYGNPVHLLIEDLSPHGFRLANQKTGLDLDHCLLAVQNLALFHASSVALKEKDSEAVESYKRGIFHEGNPLVLPAFFKAGTKALGEEVLNWPELDRRISAKLIKLSGVVVEKAREASRYQEDDFNVLNHGDFWVNNMMFRYDDLGKPISHIFVDFQVSHYGSAVLDLLFFLCTSPSDEVRINHRELLLRQYHTLLTSTMDKLKCTTKAPSYDKLVEKMQQRARYELIPSFVLLPLILLDESEAKNFDKIMAPDGKCQNPGYKGKLYRKIMTRVLPLYDNMGLLDVE